MTPEERKLVTDLFDRLATLEDAQRDPEAERAIMDGLRQAPNAVYALVQTALVQDEALKRADARIRELERAACGGLIEAGAALAAGKRVFVVSVRMDVRPSRALPNLPDFGGGPARAQPRARFDVGGDRPEPSYVRVCRRVPLVDAANRDAIIEDDPVLKVGHRWGTFEISSSVRAMARRDYARVARGQPPPPGLTHAPTLPRPATERHHRTVSRKL